MPGKREPEAVTESTKKEIRNRKIRRKTLAAFFILILACALSGCVGKQDAASSADPAAGSAAASSHQELGLGPAEVPRDWTLADIPEFDGKPAVEINGGIPDFTDADFGRGEYEAFAEFDSLGRCGPAICIVGENTMPAGEREGIGDIRPSGWQIEKYDFIDGRYLYNRCHLLGWQLTGVNAEPKNLITGTRFLNVEGMLPFENQVAYYV